MPEVEEGGALDMARFLGLVEVVARAEAKRVKRRRARAVQGREPILSRTKGEDQSRPLFGLD